MAARLHAAYMTEGKISLPGNTIGIIPWHTCNAMCRHCANGGSRSNDTAISHADVLTLIEEISFHLPAGWRLALSGGEIFLHYERMLEYIKLAKDLGGCTTLMTNGFWAEAYSKTCKIMRQLRDLGVTSLGVSTDAFHQEFVPIDNIVNIIKAAGKVGLALHVRVVATASYGLRQAVEQLSRAHPWFVTFTEMPLIPWGRARDIDSRDLIHSRKIPAGKCPGAGPMIKASGEMTLCCNALAAGEALTVGSLGEHSLRDLLKAYTKNLLRRYLVVHGPALCVRFLNSAQKRTLRDMAFTHECHLCTWLFGGSGWADRIVRGIHDRVMREATAAFFRANPRYCV